MDKVLKEMLKEVKPIKLDTILLRNIRACIIGTITEIREADSGEFLVTVTRNNQNKKFFRYTITVKPDDQAGGRHGRKR